jgi:hypothetical protein
VKVKSHSCDKKIEFCKQGGKTFTLIIFQLYSEKEIDIIIQKIPIYISETMLLQIEWIFD